MRIFRWSLDFSTEKESSISLVWIRLPMLKFSFYTSVEALKQLISKAIGIFMVADSVTLNFTKPSYARI